MKIALVEPLAVKAETMEKFEKKIREMGHELIIYSDRDPSLEALKQRSAGMDAILIANTPYRADVIDACPQLKYIDVAFTGVDHIDIDHCKEKGIAVSNASGYSDICVAELAFGMMLNLSRYMLPCDDAVRAGKDKTGLVGTELFGKVLGVIGTGKIGTRVIEIAQAFGMNVIAFSRTMKPELQQRGVVYCDSLEDLMVRSDIVTLHTPNNAQTKGLIHKGVIQKMKPSAVFINTARGPIVDSKALADALNEGKIAAAGIDVFEMEPPIPAEHPLLNAKNTLLAPHVAFATKEAMERRAEIVFENMYQWINGNVINKIC
jgi:D-3-phosphoglycerate dehydrogenase